MNRQPIDVLVLLEDNILACSGPGTIKALKMSAFSCTVHAAAPDVSLGALYLADRTTECPSCDDEAFFPWLSSYCRQHGIGAVLVDNIDFARIAKQRIEIEQATGARVLVQPEPVIAIAEDKLLTSRWLAENQLRHPGFAPSNDRQAVDALVANHGFPLIAKPYAGRGSIGVLTLKDHKELADARQMPDMLIQQFVGNDTSEFTVNCFVDRAGCVQGMHSFRRRLWHGISIHCVVDRDPAVLQLAEAIARRIGARGSINVQIRLHEGAAYCLEVNPRFSGTTAMRASLGYNDVEHAFAHYVFDEPAKPLPVITEGIAMRHIDEIYPTGSAG